MWKTVVVIGTLLASLALVACGGSTPDPASTPAQSADDQPTPTTDAQGPTEAPDNADAGSGDQGSTDRAVVYWIHTDW